MKAFLKSVLAIILLVSSISLIQVSISLEQNNTEHDSHSINSTVLLKVESPIEILSDKDFLSYSFPGNGSKADPFRIENLEIVTSNTYGILVQNTTKNILIQNNKIMALAGAIRILNTSLGTVIINNNTCSSEGLGIFVSVSPFIRIVNNTCNNSYDGININDSPYSLIESNTLKKNHVGIRIEHNIPYSKIVNNDIINNYDGIWITNSRNMLFKDNLIRNNVNGFLLDSTDSEFGSRNCVIRNNLFENNTSYALILTALFEQIFTIQNRIYHNSFVNNNPNGYSQAKDVCYQNEWFNESLKEGNYWSNWWGFFPYNIDGSANAKDMYPLEAPLHSTITKLPLIFIGRFILIISLSIGIPLLLSICIIIVKKFKKQKFNAQKV